MFSLRLRHDAILLLFGIALVFQLTCTVAARGEDPAESQAKAALALAKAKREREAVKLHATSCHTDYTTAAKEAEKSKKPLVLWVGVKCAEYPSLRKALSEAVHCHMDAQRGDDTPRVVIQGGDGLEYYVRPEKFADDTAAKIRKKWDAPYIPPARTDGLIVEEFSYVPVIYGVSSPSLPVACLSG